MTRGSEFVQDENALLFSQGAVLTGADQVERALARMWQAPANAAGAGEPAATRICSANLIVVGDASCRSELIEVLGELSPLYPTRSIVLLVEDPEAADGRLRASVSAICHVPQDGQTQVCAEQIILQSGAIAPIDLDETVLSLLEADVPVMTWWTIDPQGREDLLGGLRAISRRFILDAGLAGFPRLESTAACAVRELGWYRIVRWRELVAAMFDDCPDVLTMLDDVAIEVGRREVGPMTHGIWLAAFLGGQLGWRPRSAEADGAILFDAGGREVRVRIERSGSDWHGITGIRMAAGTRSFAVRRCTERLDEVRMARHDSSVCQVPRSMQIPRVSRSDALAQSLVGRAVDQAFSRAMPLAEWMGAARCRV